MEEKNAKNTQNHTKNRENHRKAEKKPQKILARSVVFVVIILYNDSKV